MSYGKVREPGILEAYFVDPDCPDDMYMTPDSKFWAKCTAQQAKARFYPTVVAIVIQTDLSDAKKGFFSEYKMEIRKECLEPWFSLIKIGKKTYEGGVKQKFWKDVKVGDIFVLFYKDEDFRVKVAEVLEFVDFQAAYRSLGEKLLPGVKTEKECWKIYNQFFSDETISNYGVVAVRIYVYGVDKKLFFY